MTDSQDPTDLPQAQSTTSEADADHGSGDAAPQDRSVAGISDEQLPDDLKPGEDNPLAEPLDPEDPATKSPEELGVLEEGETDQESDHESDQDSEPAADTDSGSMQESGDQGQAGISGG